MDRYLWGAHHRLSHLNPLPAIGLSFISLYHPIVCSVSHLQYENVSAASPDLTPTPDLQLPLVVLAILPPSAN
jgi:hypothetical protein